MNDDLETTDRQIELATTRQLPPEADHDHEAQALRDGWLALGRSLEVAGQDLDQAALAASLQAELIDRPQLVRPAPRANAGSWWPAILGTALALTMLVAVIRSLPLGNPNGGTQLATNSSEELPEIPAWFDPLDDQIDEATLQVQALVAQSAGIDDSLSGISQQLESMSDDLQHGSL